MEEFNKLYGHLTNPTEVKTTEVKVEEKSSEKEVKGEHEKKSAAPKKEETDIEKQL